MVLKSLTSWFICRVQIEGSKKEQTKDYSANSFNNLNFCQFSFFFYLRIWSRLRAIVGKKETEWYYILRNHSFNGMAWYFNNKLPDLFYAVSRVVITVYYFPERHTCKIASYWQLNCRLRQQSCLVLWFFSIQLLELSEVLWIMWRVWYVTS